MSDNIYDNKDFFDNYIKLRNDPNNIAANEIVEMPAIYSVLPDLTEKRVLDLGCGSGNNCMKAVELGASYVVGIDVSKNMINLAKQVNLDEKIHFMNLPMEEIASLNQKFDVVTSSLAFHYVEDYDKLVKDIYGLLNENGQLIFSQEHPLSTGTILNEACNSSSKLKLGGKEYKLLSDYNVNGPRVVHWLGETYTKYHRNISSLVNGLIENHYRICKIVEPIASEENVKRNAKFKNQLNMPYFMIIVAEKG